MSQRGKFVTFEGGEGTGKSTQIKLLSEALGKKGIGFTTIREPGGTKAGEMIRDILLDVELELPDVAELLLFEASRAQIIYEIITPKLAQGINIVADRFYDSTTAYQGYGRGLDPDFISFLNAFVTDNLAPDLTVLLDIDPVAGIERATGEGADRLESEDIAFHHRVREGFLTIARSEPERIKVIDASGSVEEVHRMVMQTVLLLFEGGV